MEAQLVRVNCLSDEDWLAQVLTGVRREGCCLVEGVLTAEFTEETRRAMYRAREVILREIGEERLRQAGELGVLRLMLKYEPHFLRFLELPALLAVIDQTVGETAILHLQNGLLLPSLPGSQTPSVFQNRFHRDFPRFLNGYLASINLMFAIDGFTNENGGTLLVPGTHQRDLAPDPAEMNGKAVAVECAAGSMIVFDSTLWHAAGPNRSGRDRLGINNQFTRPWIKQQIDYVRAVGDQVVLAQAPRTQQLLGWYSRVVTSLDEFYRPEADRLYRRGQG